MADRLPSLPLFVDDYEGATAHLTLEEDGAYMRLLRLCWRTPRCSIPDDHEWIKRRLRVDQDTFDRVVAPIIDEFFKRSRGRIFQKRLLQEFEYANDRKAKRKEAGKKGGTAKALKDKDKAPSNANLLPEQNSSNAVAPRPTPDQTIDSKKEGAIAPSRETALPVVIDQPDDTQIAFDRHDALRREFVPNARAVDLSPERKRHLAARLKDVGGLEGWADTLAIIRGSPFLRGETSRNGFVAVIDWLLKPANLRKVREGNYDHDEHAQPHRAVTRPSPVPRSPIAGITAAWAGRGVD
ncbi:YdaU family protein [Novosphingobium sp. 9]|uniref:YdaU family protein n=1 Tax=Novosphingobium sp. 9 TaxID=2025349 RepID=UPI0021B6D387|nr:YdaU family protein [Novosphingobium sp. 9]